LCKRNVTYVLIIRTKYYFKISIQTQDSNNDNNNKYYYIYLDTNYLIQLLK